METIDQYWIMNYLALGLLSFHLSYNVAAFIERHICSLLAVPVGFHTISIRYSYIVSLSCVNINVEAVMYFWPI